MDPLASAAAEHLIELRGVDKTYDTPAGPVHALRGIDLRVDAGELLGVVGPSGSGKSTLLNLLAAIDRPSAGTVRIGGADLGSLDENGAALWRGGTVGIVFQFFQLLPTLSALENVMLPMDFRGRPRPAERRERALALLERVGVGAQANRLPEEMSGGQRQRVAIARALANDPPLLLADEPTGNLDSVTSGAVLDLFAALAAEGRTVVLVTHEPGIARIADRTVTLADGTLDTPPPTTPTGARDVESPAPTGFSAGARDVEEEERRG